MTSPSEGPAPRPVRRRPDRDPGPAVRPGARAGGHRGGGRVGQQRRRARPRGRDDRVRARAHHRARWSGPASTSMRSTRRCAAWTRAATAPAPPAASPSPPTAWPPAPPPPPASAAPPAPAPDAGADPGGAQQHERAIHVSRAHMKSPTTSFRASRDDPWGVTQVTRRAAEAWAGSDASSWPPDRRGARPHDVAAATTSLVRRQSHNHVWLLGPTKYHLRMEPRCAPNQRPGPEVAPPVALGSRGWAARGVGSRGAPGRGRAVGERVGRAGPGRDGPGWPGTGWAVVAGGGVGRADAAGDPDRAQGALGRVGAGCAAAGTTQEMGDAHRGAGADQRPAR